MARSKFAFGDDIIDDVKEVILEKSNQGKDSTKEKETNNTKDILESEDKITNEVSTKSKVQKSQNVSTKPAIKLSKKASSKTIRTIYLRDDLYQKLSNMSKDSGLSISEVINEILDQVI